MISPSRLAMAGSLPAIRLERLTRRYGARRGVSSLTLDVAQGEVFGFLGPNGTTALSVWGDSPLSGIAWAPVLASEPPVANAAMAAAAIIKRRIFVPSSNERPGMAGPALA